MAQLFNLFLGIMLLTTDFRELTGQDGDTIPVKTIVYLNLAVLALPFIQVLLEMLMVQYRRRELQRKLHAAKDVQGQADMRPQQDIFVQKHPSEDLTGSHLRSADDKEEVRLRMAPHLLSENEDNADVEWQAKQAAIWPKASIMIISPDDVNMLIPPG